MTIPHQTNTGIKANINAVLYDTTDISSGGVNVHGMAGDFSLGQSIPLVLNIPFRTFSLDITLNAQVQHYDRDQHVLGLIFVDLNTDHAAHLNRALKAFASGDIIATNSLSKTVMRDNFIKVAKLAEIAVPIAPQAKKQVIGMSLAGLLGFAALAFILFNIYQGVFTVSSNDAMVAGEEIQIRATATGIFTSTLDDNTSLLKQGDEIGKIAGASGSMTNPCNCLLLEKIAHNGEYVLAGEKLATLTPIDAKPWIIAEVNADKALRIANGAPVKVTIAGSEIVYAGKTVSVLSSMNTSQFPGVTQRFVRVKIALDQEIPAEFIGKPAQAVFTVR